MSLHPNADILVFGDFNVHHQEWLIHSNNLSGLEAYNFSISQSLTQIVDFPTRFPDHDEHNPHLLDLFLTSNPTICKPSGLSPLGNSDHAVVQIDISSNFKRAPEAPFHRTLYSYNVVTGIAFVTYFEIFLGNLFLIYRLKTVLKR